MAGCKLTQNITKDTCAYDVAGVVALYLINYDRDTKYESTEGQISTITPAGDGKAYQIDFEKDTASFTDELAEGGNGGKYRTHTVNFTIGKLAYDKLNEGKNLSLGKFTAIVVDKNQNCFVLGRNNGLSATSFNYESGAADADAKGWTVVMAGTEMEIAPLLKDEEVVKSILHKGENIEITK